MKLTKQQALEKIEELKKYVAEKEAEEKKGFVIKNWKDNSEIYVSKADNIREAVIEAVANGANLSEASLWGANLSEANLSEASLWGADLEGANLYEANLCGADLEGANLSEASLWGANLRGANLYGADLYGANLREANLYGADLREAELCNAKFYGKGGTVKLKKDQVEDFLNALGFQIEG